MESKIATDLLATLAHEGRLAAFRLLVRRLPEGVRPSEIAEALALKPNTLSQYLAALERAGLVQSERAGKAVHYRADMGRMGALVDYLIADCGWGRLDPGPRDPAPILSETGGLAMEETPFNALFICTGNSARSIFAEVLLRDLGGKRFHAYSAGTHPSAAPNPHALDLLARQGHDVTGLHSKDIAAFQGPGAPQMDFVFTVCDNAANEECPPWPGQPMTAHWGLPDPVKAEGTEAEKALAFATAYKAMRRRIEAFTSLPFADLDRLALQRRLDELSDIDD